MNKDLLQPQSDELGAYSSETSQDGESFSGLGDNEAVAVRGLPIRRANIIQQGASNPDKDGGDDPTKFDPEIGASQREIPKYAKIATEKMKQQGVTLVVTGGNVTGVSLTAEAIEQLRRKLPDMSPIQRRAALRIILAYTLAQKGGGPGDQVGAIEDDSVVQTAAAVDPTGLVSKALGIKKLISNLFGGGMKEEMKRRTGMMDTFKKAYETMEPAISQYKASPVLAWANTVMSDGKGGMIPLSSTGYSTGRWSVDPWRGWIDGIYKDKVYNDKTKNNTGGFSNADAALGGQANAASIAGIKTRDGSTNIFLIQAERINDVTDLFLKVEADKLKANPTPQDLATAAGGAGEDLGKAITTAQDQTGKTTEEAVKDLTTQTGIKVPKTVTMRFAKVGYAVVHSGGVGASTAKTIVNVRKGPGTTYDIIAKVETGQEFPVIEEKDGWVNISLPGGGSGWSSAQYFKITSKEVPTQPAMEAIPGATVKTKASGEAGDPNEETAKKDAGFMATLKRVPIYVWPLAALSVGATIWGIKHQKKMLKAINGKR